MIYDCFMYNGEANMLEIRFNLLNQYVDKFVICESDQTFSGKWKPLYWAERDDRFDEWEKKIIHVIVGTADFNTPFERAGHQKDSIRKALLNCDPEDMIYYGDVDEIWKPQVEEGKLRQLSYSYYLNNRSSEDWQGTNVFKYKNIKDLNEIRADHSVVLEDGGWHFTNMGNHDFLMNKLDSYDHQEANVPWVTDNLQMRMDMNIDYLGRTHDWKGNPFVFWKDKTQLPRFILDNEGIWREKNLWK